MNKKIFWLMVMILLVSLLVVGCQSAEETPVPEEGEDAPAEMETVTITIWDFGGSDFAWLDDIAIPEFEEKYPNIKSIGVEVAHYMLDAADELPENAKILAADLHDPYLAMKAESVDVVVASVVLHEMHQPIKAFYEVARLLKPGGMFYILDWVRVPLKQYLSNSEVEVFNKETSAIVLEDLFVLLTKSTHRFSMSFFSLSINPISSLNFSIYSALILTIYT